ncbi:NAD-dependent epimerase/dehydratase family protein [Virgibacillus ndiopensis]|uniref:NAD-dependent epimerase/dehydratase family protein n=1 Tax=Virgibacillus ndiopensis TaxID=2004408 RepID=UPI000C074205|nr:NAD-dependent epimerase/dehydratase family protein [Virgibacillus ndiopensis]
MKILVMGGTRFFGRRLVELLLQDGHDITIATRGQTSDDFGEKVKRIKIDRTDQGSMNRAFENRYFDVVYDQICFNPREAKIAVETFGNRIKRYVFTSSMAVYGHKETEIVESDFIPENYKVNLDADDYAYDEGKRQAEAYFFQHGAFPVVAVRVAMVVSGNDDFTGRFDFYVGHVANGKSIGVFETEHPITYVTAWDIADFLRMMGVKSGYQGPINAGNSGYLSIQELSREIGKFLGVSPRFHVGQSSHDDAKLSPYAIFPYTWKLSNSKANSFGYEFVDIRKVIPLMVEQSAKRLGIEQ